MAIAQDKASGEGASPPPTFNRERHIKYHLRCLKTFLPSAYLSNDSNRMMLAYFTLSSLDLLSVLVPSTTTAERTSFADWIYTCQLPEAGFRCFPGSDFAPAPRTQENSCWDPANLPGTLFALLNLIILEDDLGRVKRRAALNWLRKLQCDDGSFGELLGRDGKPQSGRDMRLAYMAMCVRTILRSEGGGEVDGDDEPKDINVESLTGFVLASQTYDGGFAKSPGHESHAGLTLCAVATLELLGRLPSEEKRSQHRTGAAMSPENVAALTKWLVSRQQSYVESDEEDAYDEDSESDEGEAGETGFQVLGALPASAFELAEPLRVDSAELLSAGFNGRCNKRNDTCYSFWVSGALDVLGKTTLIDFNANRRFLLEETQHVVGGFGKTPGDNPDVLHSFFGLAALSLMRDDGFQALSSTLVISTAAQLRVQQLPWKSGLREA